MAENLKGLRTQDLKTAQDAWVMYRDMGPMRDWPRRQLRKREFIAGYLRGVTDERSHQTQHVHPAIMRMQHLLDVAEMAPEAFEEMKRQNPEAVRKLRDILNEWQENTDA